MSIHGEKKTKTAAGAAPLELQLGRLLPKATPDAKVSHHTIVDQHMQASRPKDKPVLGRAWDKGYLLLLGPGALLEDSWQPRYFKGVARALGRLGQQIEFA